MAIKLSDLFGSMDEAFNNPKLEEMFNKTKDVAENMSKKSAERLEISRKKVAKLYEKFGKLNYAKYIGDEISDDEIKDCANAIADNKEKIELYTVEIEKAKAEFNESMANMAKKTKEAFSTDFNTKPEAEAEAVEVVEAKDVEIKDSDE